MPERIAVLGGGIGSLSAVLDLTSEQQWQRKYDITVYQMGWRLGGKGASSRNPEISQRIEEHGLHIWLGFYENAFELIRGCYSEGAANSGTFASWQDAFKPHSLIVLEEKTTEGWLHWPADTPTNDSLPGDGVPIPTLWDYVLMAFEMLEEELARLHQHTLPNGEVDLSSWSTAIMSDELTSKERTNLPLSTRLLKAAHRRARKARRRREPARRKEVSAVLDDFQRTVTNSVPTAALTNPNVRRPYIFINIFSAIVRGIIADGVMATGFDALDEFELREWLARHGASPIAIDSAGMRAAYGLAFSFEDGDPLRPNLAAGVGVRCTLRMLLTYKGALLWKMQAGMGETVFTPIYKVLKARGVKFKFFHKVDELILSQDQSRIGAVKITKQATVASGDYQPFCRVKLWDCWHREPDYSQLAEGEALKICGANLESNWSTWPGVGELVLTAGIDFDKLILGIPVAALKSICRQLVAVRPEWKAMIEHVKTTQTQGFQVWMKKDLAASGWSFGSPIVGSYVEPLDTWADMSHLLSAEDWPPGDTPLQLAYFCGVMKDAGSVPPSSESTFPATEYTRVLKQATDYLDHYSGYLWPSFMHEGTFDWNVCYGGSENGIARFDSQYWRANIDPCERYTLAVTGSTKYRLTADHSGFTNLLLTGDWIRNGMNSPGCIESSVIAGRQAARAISGRHHSIIGESDFPGPKSFVAWLLIWLTEIWTLITSRSRWKYSAPVRRWR
jgi:uncharacterized protein with NAD-binding domain and iron-sulfur cluster